MKIAFLGKGGSGKSTLSTAAVKHLLNKGYVVLAVDADHNMDLSFNLGVHDMSKFLGSDPYSIKRYVGMSDSAGFNEAKDFAKKNGVYFSLNPLDSFTEQVTTKHGPNLFVMAAGPHTDIVRSGEHCSHSLAAPLKTYLPLLKLNKNEAVVIDERAGTDPVATGILNGVDCAVIVVEPTVHSVKVANQIAEELSLAKINYVFAANKTNGNNDEFLNNLTKEPIVFLKRSEDGSVDDLENLFQEIARM